MLWHGKNFRGFLNKASQVLFNKTGTNLISTNAEDAIKEVNSNLPQFIYIYQSTINQLAVGGSETITLTTPLALQNKTIIKVIPVCANPQAHTSSYALITTYDENNGTINIVCQGSGVAQKFTLMCMWIYKD